MKHIENMVPDLGIRHDPTPPKDPSLNRAEKFIDTIWRAARSMMIARNVPDKYFHYAISYAVYVHNRCANHQNDGSITPYEATRGVRPSIGHLKTFFSDCYIHVDKTERDKQKKRGLHHHRATPGYFLGFADNHSHSQYAVLDRYTMRLRHSRSVTFRTDLLSPPRNPNPANDTDKGIEVINEPLDIYDLIDQDGMPPGTTRTKNPVAKKPVTDDEWQAWYRTTDNFTIDIDPITEEQARGWPESYVDLGEDDAVMAEHGWDPHSIYWDLSLIHI